VTGASDDDPSGIATYSQAGASHGFSLLWTALLTFPLMAAVQEICDRTALATGSGLGELAVKRFNRTGRSIVVVLVVVLVIANTLNVAADLVAVGSGMNLLHAGPAWLWALVAGTAITALLVVGSFQRIAAVFKTLSFTLLVYIVVFIIATHQWGEVLRHTFVPTLTFNRTSLALFVAILGTTISPYLFFWQSAQRLEEMRAAPEGGRQAVPLKSKGTRAAVLKERTSRFDVFGGMALSNVVMFAIIATTADTLHAHHEDNIQSAAQAAKSLSPIAGHFASTIFALGFIGSGCLAIPVLAASGSVGLSGLLGKEWGLSQSPRKAPFFYVLVALGTLGGTALSLLSVNPIKLLVFVAVINGVTAAPLLVVVMRISSSRNIMGSYVNGHLASTLGWATAILMAVAAIALFSTGGVSF
jgi:NRAMP (natural resistance-associated macrophage protein)-like metal ion transporter